MAKNLSNVTNVTSQHIPIQIYKVIKEIVILKNPSNVNFVITERLKIQIYRGIWGNFIQWKDHSNVINVIMLGQVW